MSFLNENGLSYYDNKIKQNIDNLISTHNISSNSHQDIRDLLDMALKEVKDWKDIQQLVRLGLAPMLFQIGDQFTCKRGNEELVWDLIGIDQDVPTTSTATISGTGITAVDVDYIKFIGVTEEAGTFILVFDGNDWKLGQSAVTLLDYGITATGTPAEGDKIEINIPHSITFQMHDVFSETLIFNPPQAAFYIDEEAYPNGLAAGTYWFLWAFNTGQVVKGNYQFTLTQPVPVGGQIFIVTNSNTVPLTSCTIITYATVSSTVPIEDNVVISSGSDGTNIGSINSSTPTSTHPVGQWIMLGNNNYKNSTIRQWLNTDGAANTWWQPQANFDRPANTDKDGFLYGMDEDFISVLGTITKTTQKSSPNGGGLETSSEKVFLLSRPEVYGGAEGDIPDGIPYSYYKDNSDLSEPGTDADTNRIKRNGTTAVTRWLRTAVANSGSSERLVQYSGAIVNANAYSSYYVAPAVVIY